MHKIHVRHFHAFCYKWVANLNLSFLVAKAMIGTQLVIQFRAHKQKINKSVAPERHS